MATKGRAPPLAKPRTKKSRPLAASTSLATDSNTESVGSGVSSRTRARTRKVADRVAAWQARASRRDSEEPLLALLHSAATAVESSAAGSEAPLASYLVAPGVYSPPELNPGAGRGNQLAVNGAEHPCASGSSVGNIPRAINLPGVHSLLGVRRAGAQALATNYCGDCSQPTPSPMMPELTPPFHGQHLMTEFSAPVYSTTPGWPLPAPPAPLLPSQAKNPRRSPRQPAMKFVYAIFRFVENSANWSWIRWNPTGDEVMISDWDVLIDSLTDLGFGCTKRESVMKNFYGYAFRLTSDARNRIPSDDGIQWSSLQHDQFRRGRPDLLKLLTRVPQPPRSSAGTGPTTTPSSSSSS